MIPRDELTNTIYQILGKDLLEKAAVVDEIPNSVQIRGKTEVNKIVFRRFLKPRLSRSSYRSWR
jgi:hypothetical protein